VHSSEDLANLDVPNHGLTVLLLELSEYFLFLMDLVLHFGLQGLRKHSPFSLKRRQVSEEGTYLCEFEALFG
jgi:hypothetical protein